MRLISGKYKGRILKSVVSQNIRPTSDKIRGAIFNILQFEIEGKRVCDLFSGTGAIGIEALSRGSKHATFVEKNIKASMRIKENLDILNVSPIQYAILNMTVIDFLKKNNAVFDLIFIDPPYDQLLVEETLREILATKAISSGGKIIVEHSLSEKIADNLKNLEVIKVKDYSSTRISIFLFG